MKVKTISMVISPYGESDVKELDKRTNELLIEKTGDKMFYADIVNIQDTISALREVQGPGNRFLVLRRITYK